MKNYRLFQNSLISGTLLLTGTGVASRFIGFYYKIFLSGRLVQKAWEFTSWFSRCSLCFYLYQPPGSRPSISRFTAGCARDRQAKGYLAAGLSLSVTLALMECLSSGQTPTGSATS